MEENLSSLLLFVKGLFFLHQFCQKKRLQRNLFHQLMDTFFFFWQNVFVLLSYLLMVEMENTKRKVKILIFKIFFFFLQNFVVLFFHFSFFFVYIFLFINLLFFHSFVGKTKSSKQNERIQEALFSI